MFGNMRIYVLDVLVIILIEIAKKKTTVHRKE